MMETHSKYPTFTYDIRSTTVSSLTVYNNLLNPTSRDSGVMDVTDGFIDNATTSQQMSTSPLNIHYTYGFE